MEEMLNTTVVGSTAIEELEALTINGSRQYLLIRGKNCNNPILLFVHGGPGQGEIGYMTQAQEVLEENFIVVRWDQRGAGLSRKDKMSHQNISKKIIIEDVLAVTDYLRERFAREKIYLCGHSWGTIIATHAVYEHPEKYAAYIGVSQFVDGQKGEVIAYRDTLAIAKERQASEVIEILGNIGEPPYNEKACLTRAQCMGMLGMICRSQPSIDMHEAMLASPYYDTVTKNLYYENAFASTNILIQDIMQVSFLNHIKEFQLPVFFLAGRFDYHTPLELMEEYYKCMRAPMKELIVFEHSGHLPQLEETKRFEEVVVGIKEKIEGTNRAEAFVTL